MDPPFAPPKRDFIGKPAPPGYVAGVGRGATGFTTRSDIGPARELGAGTSSSHQQASFSASGGSSLKRTKDQDADDEDIHLNDSNYDEFAGYGGSLFNKDPYEEDDEEADRIYDAIDKHLDERGKLLREVKTRQELEVYRQKRPKIQLQFSDLKANLDQVSEEEWMNIPEVGDARNRKQRVARQDKFTPVPDSLLAHQAKLASGGDKLVYIEPKSIDNDDGSNEEDDGDGNDNDDDHGDVGVDRANKELVAKSTTNLPSTQQQQQQRPKSSSDIGSNSLNIGEMSDFRSSYMSMKLSRISSQNSDQSVIANPRDYLTNLQAIPTQITDAGTLKEYRKQFAALRTSNPTFENAWIASVRLEEAAGKLKAARQLILAACERCPKSADLWCEAIRLHPVDISKALMVRALREVPRSVKLWIRAADLESDEEAKRRVYAKAREIVPKSVLLWKRSVELEQTEEAKTILKEAVECCPEAVELWLALARLLPYEEARRVLIKASEHNPKDKSIWITAAKLEEAAGNKSLVNDIISRAIEQLQEKGVECKRADWLKEAVDADKAGFSLTCSKIVQISIGWNVDQEKRLDTWLDDVKNFIANKSIGCARAVFKKIVSDNSLCKLESVWLAYADFERQHGDIDDDILSSLLRQATSPENCIKSESLWLMLAKLNDKKLNECRQILVDALDANPDSERIIMAAVELECDNGYHKEARRILADACMSAKTSRLVLRSAKLERSLGNLDEAVRMLKAGIEEYKDASDLYLMLGEIEESRSEWDRAKSYYSLGLKFSPTSVALWISLAAIEERTGSLARARSKLEMGRLRNPKVPAIWLESGRLELRAHQQKLAKGSLVASRADGALAMLTKGIRQCKGIEGVEVLEQEFELVSKKKFV